MKELKLLRILPPKIKPKKNVNTFFQVTKIFKVSNAEQIKKLREDLRACRREQAEISIVDEFAKHARLSRKITALQTQLEQEMRLNAESSNKIRTKMTIGFNSLFVRFFPYFYLK